MKKNINPYISTNFSTESILQSSIFSKWVGLVMEKLSPENTTFLQGPNKCNQILQEIDEEHTKLQTLFLEGFISHSKIREKQQFVQLHQVLIIRLLNKLYDYQHNTSLLQKHAIFYQEVSRLMHNILDFIAEFFTGYIDYNESLPTVDVDQYKAEIKEQSKKIALEIVKHQSIEESLAAIITHYLAHFTDPSLVAITYSQLFYFKDFVKEITNEKVLLSNDAIRHVLYFLNFNDDDFVAYEFERLNLLITDFTSVNEKINQLRLELKNINQLPVKLNCVCSNCTASLKEQINNWIKEEINFLNVEKEEEFKNAPFVKEFQNVLVPFRAPEIYLLHKSFVDAGGAPVETYKSLLEKTSKRLSNKTQKGFSSESLKKASDKVDPESKETVKRFLQKMIRNVDSYE
jgi:hypothetical protein